MAAANTLAKASTPDNKDFLRIGKPTPLWAKLTITVILVGAACASLCMGKYPIPLDQILPTLWGVIHNAFVDLFGLQSSIDYLEVDKNFATALINVRLPRVAIVMLVGASLSIAGASYQGMFKNPLVSPDVLGASAGASLGASFAMLMDLGAVWVSVFAFIGASVAVALTVWVSKAVRQSDAILGLVLGGMLISTLIQSLTSLIKLAADSNNKLPEITFWLMGSFARIEISDLFVAIPMVIAFFLLLHERWHLNVMSFGEEEAKTLGINVKRTRNIVIVASTVLVGCSVAVSGIVGWVGLVIPHLARAIVGPNYKALLPTSLALGAAYLLLVDDFCRMLTTIEIPIGILTSIIGVPVFLFIFRRQNKGW